MSYGYRLNLEPVYIGEAKKSLDKALVFKGYLENMKDESLNASNYILTLKRYLFVKFNSISGDVYMEVESLMYAELVKAVIFTSLAYEAYLNLIYRKSDNWLNGSTRMEDDIFNYLKNAKRPEIFRKSFEKIHHDSRKYQKTIGKLEELYKTRNHLIHYKSGVTYQGFSFKTQLEELLEYEKVENYFKVLNNFILETSPLFDIDSKEFYTQRVIFLS